MNVACTAGVNGYGVGEVRNAHSPPPPTPRLPRFMLAMQAMMSADRGELRELLL